MQLVQTFALRTRPFSSRIVTNRMFRPNIQKVTIKDAKGHVRKANVCTKCMKAGKVTRA